MSALAVVPRFPRRVPARPRGRDLLLAVAAAVVVAGVAAVLLFRWGGGTWFVVQTPSMGTVAPVGTLLIDQPVRVADLRVGDVITFRPPTEPFETYSHRVVQLVPGGVHTRGDINGADDGWIVRQRDLVGRTQVVLPVAGWLVRGLPILIAGALFTVLLTRWPAGPRRSLARLVGTSLSAALAAAWLHPFAGMVLLQTSMAGRDVAATVVGTGILPIRVTAPGGASVHLEPGQVGLLRIDGVRPGHRIDLASALDLPWWGWAVLALVCAAPLIASVAILVRHRMLHPRRLGVRL